MFPNLSTHLWAHAGGAILAAFAASLVECVEALTIVLAVGITRGWRPALAGAFSGLVVLVVIVLAFNLFFSKWAFPLAPLQIAIGILLLLFGTNWLRKAVLRSAGLKARHDEARSYEEQKLRMQDPKIKKGLLDAIAYMVSFKAVIIEGTEVIFIVIAIGAAQKSFAPAVWGAVAAFLVVASLGVVLHKPLTRIPENTLKWGVGIIVSAFGIFWIGEGSGFAWPGNDWSILGLAAILLIISVGVSAVLRPRTV